MPSGPVLPADAPSQAAIDAAMLERRQRVAMHAFTLNERLRDLDRRAEAVQTLLSAPSTSSEPPRSPSVLIRVLHRLGVVGEGAYRAGMRARELSSALPDIAQLRAAIRMAQSGVNAALAIREHATPDDEAIAIADVTMMQCLATVVHETALASSAGALYQQRRDPVVKQFQHAANRIALVVTALYAELERFRWLSTVDAPAADRVSPQTARRAQRG